MDIKGWVRTSLIDYPDHIATILFTGGCNLRCPMCHNADLVLHHQAMPALAEEQVSAFLAQREGLIDGVVVTGGEPTMQPDLLAFLRRLRASGLDVKLDTNGYRPDVLETVIAEKLVDSIAMDVKAPLQKYPRLTGTPAVDVTRVERSIALLKAGTVDCEFRTTVVPGLLDEDDVEAIAHWLEGPCRYVLQQFRPVNTLDPDLQTVFPYPIARLHAMAERARPWASQVQVRGG